MDILTDESSPDFAVVKTEVFDLDFASQLKDNAELLKDDRDRLRRYIKQRKNGNTNQITYKLGRYCKNELLGRLTAVGGIGLQCLQKDIRAALAERYYWDVDIVNAQPTLLVQYCDERGWKCDALKRYVANRDEVLTELMTTLDIPRWEAKERVVSLLFGASAIGLTPFLVDELAPELRLVAKNIWDANTAALGFLKNKDNKLGKATAYILQTEERKCLLAIDRAFSRRGRSLDVLIHDGGLVRKKDNESALPISLLREVERDVKADTGYTITLLQKPLETTFVREVDAEDDYEDRKKKWEETGDQFGSVYFKVMLPPVFASITIDGQLVQFSKSDLLQNEENNFLADGSPFIRKWFADPNIKTYLRLVFRPKQECSPSEYNLFRGFAVDPKPGADLSRIHKLLFLISGKDERVKRYIELWLASIFQRPYQKTRVCIVVNGLEGCGKETFWNFIGNILGKHHFFTTKSPENNVFARFNFGTEKCLLVKFEEANFQTNKDNADKLKGLITQETENYEQKGKDTLTLDDYRNYVMTTNHEVPIVMSEYDRRFVLVAASNEQRIAKEDPEEVKAQKTEFWNDTYDAVRDPEIQAAYHQYLLSLDISTFVPHRDRVFTEYYQEVQSKFCRHYHSRWFQQQLEMDEERTEPLEWRARQMWESMKQLSKFEVSEVNFGKDLKQYVAAGVLTKTRDKWGVNYRCADPQALKQFLQDKGWWFEF